MPKMIKVTSMSDDVFYINPFRIITLGKDPNDKEAGAYIEMAGEQDWYVKETPEQILKLIKEAENER